MIPTFTDDLASINLSTQAAGFFIHRLKNLKAEKNGNFELHVSTSGKWRNWRHGQKTV
jgi:hypothetical protein